MNIFRGHLQFSSVMAILFIVMTSTCYAADIQQNEKILAEGESLFRNGKYPEALVKFNEGLKLSQADKTKEMEAVFLERIGLTYRRMGKYNESINTYEKSGSLYKQHRNFQGARRAYTAIGSIYMSMNNYKKSLEYFDQALLIARLSGSKREIGRALGNMGNIYYLQGKYDKSVWCYEGAINLNRESNDHINLEINICNLGNVYSGRGQYRKAIEIYSQSLKMAEKTNEADAICRNLGNLGIAYSNLMEHEKGLDYLNKALKIARDSKLEKREILWLGSLGNAYSRMGKNSEAVNKYEEAAGKAKKIGDQWSVVNYQGNIGIIYLNTGEYRKAMKLFLTALEYSEKIGDKKAEASFLCNMGIIYENLGLLNQSLQYQMKALAKAKEMGDRYSEGVYLGNIGNIYKQSGDHKKSEEYYKQALDIASELEDLRGQGMNLGNLGNACFDQKKFKESIEYYEKALEIARKSCNPISEGIRLGNMAGAYRELGQYKKALELYNTALPLTTGLGNNQSSIIQYVGRGLTYEKLNRLDDAIADMVKAVEIVETVRSDLGIEEFKNSYSNRYIYIYYELIELLMMKNRIQDALEYAERAKARSFLDVVGKSDSITEKAKDRELAEKEVSLLSLIRELEKKIYSVPQEQTADILIEIKKVQKEHQEVLEKLKIKDSEYASLISVNPSSPEEIKKSLQPGEVLVEYFTTNNATIVWILTKNSLDSYSIDADSDTVAKDVKKLREALEPVSDKDMGADGIKACNELLGKFNSRYFAPIEEIINKERADKGKANRLIIIPHGEFHLVPFAALIDSNGKYLVDKYEILTEPSASSFVLFRRRSGKSQGKFAGYALGNVDVDFGSKDNASQNRGVDEMLPSMFRSGFKPLPGTKKETEEISKEYISKHKSVDCYIEKDFTTKKVFETVPNAGVLHFATHGFVSGKAKGKFSGLITADGFIFMMDIFKWKLNADMVVLSACKTSVGEVSEGDDAATLSRAFMQAGANNLIATLWSVQDEATRELMVEFYKEILAGATKSASLRNAQLKLKKQYPHPTYWSGFVVYGRGQ